MSGHGKVMFGYSLVCRGILQVYHLFYCLFLCMLVIPSIYRMAKYLLFDCWVLKHVFNVVC